MKYAFSEEGASALDKLATTLEEKLQAYGAATNKLVNDVPSDGLGEFTTAIKQMVEAIKDAQGIGCTSGYVVAEKLHQKAQKIRANLPFK